MAGGPERWSQQLDECEHVGCVDARRLHELVSQRSRQSVRLREIQALDDPSDQAVAVRMQAG